MSGLNLGSFLSNYQTIKHLIYGYDNDSFKVDNVADSSYHCMLFLGRDSECRSVILKT